MPIVMLVRHGRSTANVDGVLAGWTPASASTNTAPPRRPDSPPGWPACRWPRSSAARCSAARRHSPRCWPPGRSWTARTDDRFGECKYGDWTGRKLSELAGEPLWKTVQQHPSAAVFPGPRASRCAPCRPARWTRCATGTPGSSGSTARTRCLLVCSHGDIIKSLVADALGMHLDLFQRMSVDPCSVTVIRYTASRPFVVRLGDTGEFSGSDAPPGGAAQGTTRWSGELRARPDRLPQ